MAEHVDKQVEGLTPHGLRVARKHTQPVSPAGQEERTGEGGEGRTVSKRKQSGSERLCS